MPLRRLSEQGEVDEGPSVEDLASFGHQGGYCPHCGEEVWDDAQFCSRCGSYFEIAHSRPPTVNVRRKSRVAVLFIFVALGLVLLLWLSMGG